MKGREGWCGPDGKTNEERGTCIKGHPWTEENKRYRSDGKVQCSECQRESELKLRPPTGLREMWALRKIERDAQIAQRKDKIKTSKINRKLKVALVLQSKLTRGCWSLDNGDGQPCEVKDPDRLMHHHIDPSKKNFELSVACLSSKITPEQAQEEIVLCAVMCHNCHAAHEKALRRGEEGLPGIPVVRNSHKWKTRQSQRRHAELGSILSVPQERE